MGGLAWGGFLRGGLLCWCLREGREEGEMLVYFWRGMVFMFGGGNGLSHAGSSLVEGDVVYG